MKETYKHYRLVYTLFAFISLIVVIYYQLRIEAIHLFQPTIVSYIIGSLVSASGLIIMMICIKKYFVGLSGIKSLVQEQSVSNQLIITGIHKYVRHPLYLGTFIFIWGLLILFPQLSLLVANSVITIYTLAAIKWEEEKLIVEFGEDYRHYRQNVPAILPRFKGNRTL